VLRVTIMNPRTTKAHLLSLLDGLEAEAGAMVAGNPADDRLATSPCS
jgi:hypothetical protein